MKKYMCHRQSKASPSDIQNGFPSNVVPGGMYCSWW
jgi:hypothetical protein